MGIEMLDLTLSLFLAIVPGKVQDRRREFAAFFLVKLLHLEIEFVHNFRIRHRLPDGFYCLVSPLSETARIADASFLLDGGGAWQHEDFGLNGLRVHARTFPE